MENSKNIVWHPEQIKKEHRNQLLGFQNKVLWFTGLSGSGKSTIARELENSLHKQGILTYVLDGDNVRHGLNSNLGFSPEDRKENIRRISEVAKLFHDSGTMTIVSFISPYKEDRDYARQLIGNDFVEVHIDCPIDECEKRDPKGLYKKARDGIIKDFTGISAPYESPEAPEIKIESHNEKLNNSVQKINSFLKF